MRDDPLPMYCGSIFLIKKSSSWRNFQKMKVCNSSEMITKHYIFSPQILSNNQTHVRGYPEQPPPWQFRSKSGSLQFHAAEQDFSIHARSNIIKNFTNQNVRLSRCDLDLTVVTTLSLIFVDNHFIYCISITIIFQ